MKKNDRLLVIGHVWPQVNATAAGEHIVHLLQFFKALEYEILFVCAAQKPETTCPLLSLGIASEYIAINDDSFDDLLNSFTPSVVLFDRFMVEEQFSWRVKKCCPNAIRVLDTEDIHFLRKQRQLEFNTGEKVTEHADITKRELASIYRCDLSLIISQTELKLLTETYQVPKQVLHYVPLLSAPIKSSETPPFKERKDVLFVGNFLHEPNWHAVQVLKKEIWPRLSKQLPEVTLHIYGSHATEKNYQLQNERERFLVHGYIEDVDTALKNSKLLLAPLYFGAGQKGKLLKAMQCGTPSVTTAIGAEGMWLESDKWPGAIADDFDQFVMDTVGLYTNEKEWNTAQQQIDDLVTRNFLYDTHLEIFKEVFTKLKDTIAAHRMANIIGEVLWHHSLRSTEYMSRWIIEKNKK